LQVPLVNTQIRIFGLKICHLATLHESTKKQRKRKKGKKEINRGEKED
jgi:hypothetical protein